MNFTYYVEDGKNILDISGKGIVPAGKFANNKFIEELHISGDITFIGEDAFANCPNLKAVYLWTYVLHGIGRQAFANCPISELVINSHVPYMIHSRAFVGCALKELFLSGFTYRIGHSAFGFCKNLEVVRLRNGVNTISYGAFTNCYKLHTVELYDTIVTLKDDAFECCNIKTVHLLHDKDAPDYDTLFKGATIDNKEMPFV